MPDKHDSPGTSAEPTQPSSAPAARSELSASESRLRPAGNSIWIVEGDIVDFFGFPYPTRCVVIRLDDGDLWIWSPIALDDALEREIRVLGPVRHLVSPNKLHYLYLADWVRAFPDALMWGPASTIRKCRDLEFQPPLTDVAPEAWRDDIGQLWFRGSFAMDEIVFFHRPSSTAIVADLSENFSEVFLQAHWGPLARRVAKLWKITEPYGHAPLELRLSWLRRGPARAALATLLSWQPTQVIMAHGEIQPTDGRAYLERAFAWLGMQ